jgi:hypothetical protein
VCGQLAERDQEAHDLRQQGQPRGQAHT